MHQRYVSRAKGAEMHVLRLRESKLCMDSLWSLAVTIAIRRSFENKNEKRQFEGYK